MKCVGEKEDFCSCRTGRSFLSSATHIPCIMVEFLARRRRISRCGTWWPDKNLDKTSFQPSFVYIDSPPSPHVSSAPLLCEIVWPIPAYLDHASFAHSPTKGHMKNVWLLINRAGVRQEGVTERWRNHNAANVLLLYITLRDFDHSFEYMFQSICQCLKFTMKFKLKKMHCNNMTD